MGLWKCVCGQEMSDDSYKEFGGVNDTYTLFYQCDNCKKTSTTVTKNVTNISGATVIEIYDHDVCDNLYISNSIEKLKKKMKLD